MTTSLPHAFRKLCYLEQSNSNVIVFFNGLATITPEDDAHEEVALLLEIFFKDPDSTIDLANLLDKFAKSWFDILNDKAKSDFDLIQDCISKHMNNLFTQNI